MAGAGPTALTVKVTGMTSGLLIAPASRTLIEPVYVPAPSVAALTDTLKEPGSAPPVTLGVSQTPPDSVVTLDEYDAVAVGSLRESVTVWAEAEPPKSCEKESAMALALMVNAEIAVVVSWLF